MMLCQIPGPDYDCRSDLRPTVTGIFGDGGGVAVLHPAETGPCIRQERVLVGLERQAPVAAAGVDRRNRAAIAVERIRRHHLAP